LNRRSASPPPPSQAEGSPESVEHLLPSPPAPTTMRRLYDGVLNRYGSTMLLLVFALLLAAAVVIPFTRSGWLLLLDWVTGPNPKIPREFWGLDEGPAYGPLEISRVLLGRAVGAATAQWLMIAVIFPLAALGMGRLVGGTWKRQGASALLFCVNPIVYSRLAAGQVQFLLAYALLPFAVRSFLDHSRSGVAGWLKSGLWMALIIAVNPAFAWIVGLILVVCVAAERFRTRAIAFAAVVLLIAIAASAHVILPQLDRPGRQAAEYFDTRNLDAFPTVSDRDLGLYGNVAGLYGFWFELYFPHPKHRVSGWAVFFLALLIVICWGAARGITDRNFRRLSVVLIVSGLAGYFLAFGNRGPFGSTYIWAFEEIGFFRVMREAAKFNALLGLAYAAFFGFGVESLTAAKRKSSLIALVAAMTLPLMYTPTLFWGLAGNVQTSEFPRSWEDADEIMGQGPGKVLFLPWFQNMPFPFTEDRTVKNPARYFFSREVISGDNTNIRQIETLSRSRRSRFLEWSLAEGPRVIAYGSLVAPLGVEYIVLAKVGGWNQYQWLTRQQDLEVVLDRPDLTVFRNLNPVFAGARYRHLIRLSDWGELLGAAVFGEVRNPVLLDSPQPGILKVPSTSDEASSDAPAPVSQESPVKYSVPRGNAGFIVIPEPFDIGWVFQGRHGVEVSGGITGFEADSSQGVVTFEPWLRVRAAYLVSSAVFLTVLGLVIAHAIWGRPVWLSAHQLKTVGIEAAENA
jgi:hypothetical protein